MILHSSLDILREGVEGFRGFGFRAYRFPVRGSIRVPLKGSIRFWGFGFRAQY